MAQILAPSVQWQMRCAKNSMGASQPTTNMWSSVVMRQNKKGFAKSSTNFRVLAVSDGSTINRMEQLLNLDVTPYTDKVIAEYIWYVFFLHVSYCNLADTF